MLIAIDYVNVKDNKDIKKVSTFSCIPTSSNGRTNASEALNAGSNPAMGTRYNSSSVGVYQSKG